MVTNWIFSGFVNWKTTITSVATAVFILLNGAGIIHVSESERATVIAALIVIFGWFAKDSDKTGTPKD